MSLNILHVGVDDKFIDLAYRDFERVAPNQNELCICTNSKPRFVKSPATLVPRMNVLFGLLPKHLCEKDLVIVHGLSDIWRRSIIKLSKKSSILWIGWGYDYYDLIELDEDGLLLPITRKAVAKSENKLASYKTVSSVAKKLLIPSKRRTVESIDYFSPVLPSEYNLAKNGAAFETFPGQLIWNYGNLEEDFVRDFLDKEPSVGNSVLVGNSAFATNNHLDIFDLFKKTNFLQRQLVCPVSYGNEEYRDLVINAGSQIFGEKITFIRDFLTPDAYAETLMNCGFAIVNSVRQQAVGNILFLLYNGAKVFLRKESPTYSWLTGQGVKIFSVQELEKDVGLLEGRLEAMSVAANRSVIASWWSKDMSLKRSRDVLHTVVHDRQQLI